MTALVTARDALDLARVARFAILAPGFRAAPLMWSREHLEDLRCVVVALELEAARLARHRTSPTVN